MPTGGRTVKTRKLISRIKELFDRDLRDDRKKVESLKAVLEQLRKKELTLKAHLAREKDGKERSKLEKKLLLVHQQRKKGLMLLKSLG